MTLTRHQWQRLLTDARASLDALEREGRIVIDNTHNQLADLDLYGTGSSETVVTSSRGDSIVERVLGTVEGVTQPLDDLKEHTDALLGVINDARRIAQQRIPLDPDELPPRCAGTGDPTGSTCTQWAVRDGRCLDCHRTHEANRKRSQRHRAAGT